MPDYDVLVVGELNADLILSDGDLVPEFGQREKIVAEASLTIGSSSAIFASQAARLGLRIAFVGKVGDDDFGRFMLRGLAELGIDASACVVDREVKTGLSVILSRGRDRAILTYLGSIGKLRASEVAPALIRRARHLHVGSYYLLEALRPDLPQLLEEVKGAGLTTSLDTNWDPAQRWELPDVLDRIDVFLPNQAEARAISGAQDADQALEVLGERVPSVAIKLGAEGAVARRGSEWARAAALPVPVVDTTGAGDSFDAGFVYGFLKGWSLEGSLRLACACGSLSTRAAGGTAAQPTLEEALAALGEPAQ